MLAMQRVKAITDAYKHRASTVKCETQGRTHQLS